ncbi:hypothetical protein AMC83_PA00038 (plasmid) [Rhizobium phaseoli]|uniref:hypothetical protein n=1 Tax=Rhizobium phaseoli TaxID=396 RepID=UPI0007EC0516|nr:hypothetical protein [Rhizobium phaseoli]ANL74265.1 hypothetical protein AMC83_PA00038 [Rhizobium phaseoli]
MKTAKEIAEFAFENLGTSEQVRAMSKEQIVSILRELTPEHSITKRFEDDSTKSYSVKDGMLREIAFDSERNVSWNVYDANSPDTLIDSMELQRSGQATRPSTLSLMERFEMGEERPPEVTEARWKAIADDYSHQMTLENIPEWYLRGGSPEDERFYDAMESGIHYESREEIVVALRELEAKGEHPEVIQGWNTYTLQGDEVFQENHESHPDRGGEWERWDANNPQRTIDSHWMQDQRNEDARSAEWDVAVELASYEKLHGAELIATLRERGGQIEHNGSSYSLSEDRLHFTKTEQDGSAELFSCGGVELDILNVKAAEELARTPAASVSNAPSSAFDLTSMMAATAKPIDDGRTVPDGPMATTSAASIPVAQTATTPSAAPTFRKGPDFSAAPKQVDGQTEAKSDAPTFRKGPDFSTTPAPKKKPEDEKLTSQTPIIQLNDFDTKPKLATDEIARRGQGVVVARKAYRVDGKEITSSYEFTTGGKVLHTGFDGKKSEMTFEQAKRHEIAEIDQLNRNAIAAINRMATDPKFSLRQGDATYSVKDGYFVRKGDDGSVKKEPLEETRKRFSERGREIDAMQPERTIKPPVATMQTVQPKAEKSQHFARMADRAEAAAVADTKSGKTIERQLGA